MRKFSQIGLILLFLLSILFHVMVLLKIIPYTIVWGGRLRSDTEMYRFEVVSLGVGILFLMIVLVKSKVVSWRIRDSILNGALWLMFGMFLLNTVGNLLSENHLEKVIFTPLTLLTSFMILVLLKTKK